LKHHRRERLKSRIREGDSEQSAEANVWA